MQNDPFAPDAEFTDGIGCGTNRELDAGELQQNGIRLSATPGTWRDDAGSQSRFIRLSAFAKENQRWWRFGEFLEIESTRIRLFSSPFRRIPSTIVYRQSLLQPHWKTSSLKNRICCSSAQQVRRASLTPLLRRTATASATTTGDATPLSSRAPLTGFSSLSSSPVASQSSSRCSNSQPSNVLRNPESGNIHLLTPLHSVIRPVHPSCSPQCRFPSFSPFHLHCTTPGFWSRDSKPGTERTRDPAEGSITDLD